MDSVSRLRYRTAGATGPGVRICAESRVRQRRQFQGGAAGYDGPHGQWLSNDALSRPSLMLTRSQSLINDANLRRTTMLLPCLCLSIQLDMRNLVEFATCSVAVKSDLAPTFPDAMLLAIRPAPFAHHRSLARMLFGSG